MRIIKSFAGFAFAPARTTTDTARPRRPARVVVVVFDDAFNRTEPETETEDIIIIVREIFRDTLSKLTPSSSPHVEHTALKTRG
jgi:hypothetical protein